MPAQVMTSDQLYPVHGPSSHAVRVGDMVFLQGTVGFDPQRQVPGDLPGHTDMVKQCEQTLANMATALGLLGGSLSDVVKVRAFLPHHCRPRLPGQPSYDETFDAVYREHFQPPRPARAALQKSLFMADLLVAMEAIAVLHQPRELIESAALPPLRRPYAQGGIRVGNLLFLRGFTAQNRLGDLVGPGDMRAQTEQTLANMGVVLQEAGGTWDDLVQTQVTLSDWHAVAAYDEVYNRHVREPFPTRTTFQGGLGRAGLLIEIESVAALATPRLTIDSAVPQVGRSILRRRDDVVYSDRLAPNPAAFAHGVRLGDLVFVSAQAGLDPDGRLVGPGDIRAQTRQALTNLQTVLQLAGLELDDVVKTTVMLTDWRHLEAYNEVYRTFFSPPYPARSTVGGGLSRPGTLIEIEAVAMAGARDTAVVVARNADAAR